MAVIIPNAGDTTSGNKYESLDQAEPDALDFEILGNAYTGVLSGCEVTSNASPNNVAVSAGTIILDGVPYTIAANPTLALPAAPSDNRFDMVVARVSGGTASLTVVSGDDSGTNPSFPRSVNLITGGGSPTTNIFPSTDVVLAALYRSGSSSVTASRIVDKRAIRNAGIMFQGTTSPTVADGVGTGQFYFDTSAQDGVKSGAYVKRADGTWASLALDVGAHFPIGGVFAWPVNAPTPVGCVEASGQGVATSQYPALFGVYGYTFGGSGGTFNMPNLNDGYSLKGATGGTVGTTTGSDTVTLTTANLPSHRHSLNNHSHTLVHDHSISHNHGEADTGDAGVHAHTGSSVYYSGSLVTRNSSYLSGNYLTGKNPNSAPYSRFYDSAGNYIDSGMSVAFHGPTVTMITTIASDGNHRHTFNMPNFTGTSGGASNTTTSEATGDTGNTGSGSSFSNVSKSQYVKWLIRASLGDDPSYTGGTPAFTAAYQETFVVELFAEGETVSADTSLGTSFRMPWAGTITDVRAAVGVPSDTGPIVIDVNEGGTVAAPGASILSTKLSIDEGEYTSFTASTPHVISDNSFADDALVTFDVDSAGANAQGPLTVTLYITRAS